MQFLIAAYAAVELHLVRKIRFYSVLVVLVLLLTPLIGFYVIPSARFPERVLIEVREDAPTEETIAMLEQEGVITSRLAFKAAARVFGADRTLHAGRYLFTSPVGTAEVLYRLANGISGIPVIRVTFPEGMASWQMAERLDTSIPGFDAATFRALAKEHEGYLFPDTYDLYGDTTPEEVIERLMETFTRKTAELEDEIVAFGRPLTDVVIMASLVEREGKTLEDKRMIAGILWSRIDADVALQVDAVFGYIKGIETYHPSFADLETDSPYNTYRNRGLPPTAIANPGLESLLATVTPTPSDYFYYLTGRDGKMYYAKTFEEHKENRERYLD